MPLHPAAPEDLAGLLAAYQQTIRAVVDLGRTCSEDDFARPTAWAGWTVKDQISHIVGLESWLHADIPVPVPAGASSRGAGTGGAAGGTGGAAYRDRVRSEAGRVVDKAVAQRRHMVGSKVVTELETIATRRIQQLSAPDLSPETVIRGVWGPAPAREGLRARILDIWTHEQDIRHALGRPGDLDSGAAAVFCDVLFEALPGLVAGDAAVPPGNVVIIDMTGPVVGRAGVRVETDETGRAYGIPLFTGVAHEGSGVGEEVTTSITLSTDALTRRAAGRGTLEDIHYTVHGDEDVARQVLDHLAVVP